MLRVQKVWQMVEGMTSLYPGLGVFPLITDSSLIDADRAVLEMLLCIPWWQKREQHVGLYEVGLRLTRRAAAKPSVLMLLDDVQL